MSVTQYTLSGLICNKSGGQKLAEVLGTKTGLSASLPMSEHSGLRNSSKQM